MPAWSIQLIQRLVPGNVSLFHKVLKQLSLLYRKKRTEKSEILWAKIQPYSSVMKSPDRCKERSGYARQTAVYVIHRYGGVRGAPRYLLVAGPIMLYLILLISILLICKKVK